MNRRVWLYRLIWWLISIALVMGMITPMLTFTMFYIFDDTYSLAAGIFHLLDEGEPVLFVLVFSFSMLMPAYKMYLLYRLIPFASVTPDNSHHRRMRRLDWVGKWSMLDVFVIAILVVTIKLATVASIQIHYGLYVFSAAVVASMVFAQTLNSIMVKKHAQKLSIR